MSDASEAQDGPEIENPLGGITIRSNSGKAED